MTKINELKENHNLSTKCSITQSTGKNHRPSQGEQVEHTDLPDTRHALSSGPHTRTTSQRHLGNPYFSLLCPQQILKQHKWSNNLARSQFAHLFYPDSSNSSFQQFCDSSTRTYHINQTYRSIIRINTATDLLRMAHLPSAEITARREAATQDILSVWNTMQGAEWYALMCPCRIDCGCMPEDEIPRIVLNNCMYVGELDYFFVTQPFQATYGFQVRWYCDECESEMACGFPMS